MTVSYILGPEPIWVIINNVGTTAGGATMGTFHSQNKTSPKPVYQDAGGTLAWTNPIVFDLDGTQGPFYFAVDDTDLADTYYLEVNDADGNLIWSVDNFFPGGSGGGGDVTTFISLQNYITNNQFINHIPDQGSTLPVNLVIAPSNHKGFTPALINPIIGTYGALGPDIRFVKNNTSATDSLSFPTFSLGSAPLNPSDTTPVRYIRYVSSANGASGESYKCFQFPITQKVKNLSNQKMTLSLWAAVTATPVTINIFTRQYYGSGTAATAESVATRPLQGSCSLTTTWTQFFINFTMPNVGGNSIGTPGSQTDDDAVYVQIEMPLNAPSDVLFTKPCLYLGTIDQSIEFESYDQIDSINSTARTGDIKTSLISSPPLGWLAMNDTSIGNTGSGATTAGDFTFQLYKTLWDGVDNAWAPVSGGRGASAVADFIANKTLTMPLSLGRALAGAGAGAGLTARALGQNLGEETHTLTIPEIPSHSHPGLGGNFVTTGSGTNAILPTGNLGTVGTTGFTGGGGSHNNMQPTSFFNVFIKL